MPEGNIFLGKCWILKHIWDRPSAIHGLLDVVGKEELRTKRIKYIL